MSAGPLPTRMVATTRLLSGSMRETVSSPKFATQTAPAPKATPCGPRPTLIGLPTLFVLGIDPADVALDGVGDPDGALADGDAGRLEPGDDGLLEPDASRVHADHAAAEAGGGPHRALAERHVLRGLADLQPGRPSTFFSSGSTLTIVPPSAFRTHMPPSPIATADGAAPTSISSAIFSSSSPPVSTTTSTTIAATAITASATSRSGKRLGCGPVDIVVRPRRARGAAGSLASAWLLRCRRTDGLLRLVVGAGAASDAIVAICVHGPQAVDEHRIRDRRLRHRRVLAGKPGADAAAGRLAGVDVVGGDEAVAVIVLEPPVHSRQSSVLPVLSSQPARFQRAWGNAIVLLFIAVPLVDPQNMTLALQSFGPPRGLAQLSAITLR